MRVSDLTFLHSEQYYLESKTDEMWTISTEFDKRVYIDRFGDQRIVRIEEKDRYAHGSLYYAVPAFFGEQNKYRTWKVEQCRIWGCE